MTYLFSVHPQGQEDGTTHYLVQAKLAILIKQFKEAESILVENVRVLVTLTEWSHVLIFNRVNWIKP